MMEDLKHVPPGHRLEPTFSFHSLPLFIEFNLPCLGIYHGDSIGFDLLENDTSYTTNIEYITLRTVRRPA